MDYEILYKLYYKDKQQYELEYNKRINDSVTEIFDFNINGYPLYLYLYPKHYQKIFSIQKIDKQLGKIADELPGVAIQQFIKDTLITEIKHTNDIEGIFCTKKEIMDIMDQLSTKKHERLYGMVNRYMFLIDHKTFNLNSAIDIRNIYDELVSKEIYKTDPNDQLDGTLFRKDVVYIKTKTGKTLHTGVTPERKIIEDLEKALKIIEDDDINILVRIAIFHYLFGYIHPFYDGNGRVNRFISSYLLSQHFTPLIGYRLSQQIKIQKKVYDEAFEHMNHKYNRGDLGTFIMYFLEILENAFKDTLNLLIQKNDQLDHFKALITNCDLAENQKSLLFVLIQVSIFSDFGLSMKNLTEYSVMSEAWIRKTIASFKKQGMVKTTKQGHTTLYAVNIEVVEDIYSH